MASLIFLLIFALATFTTSSCDTMDGISWKRLDNDRIVVRAASIRPPSHCTRSSKGKKRGESLQVVAVNGPCYKHLKRKPTSFKILTKDQDRVSSMHSGLRSCSNNNAQSFQAYSRRLLLGSQCTRQVTSAVPFSYNSFVVIVELGSPRQKFSLIVDTGSHLTWTQCQPCEVKCYEQQEPIFNPTQSSSYSNISINSDAVCKLLATATGNDPYYYSNTCIYTSTYGDGSSSVGYFAEEKLTLSAGQVFHGFLFGCGQDNWGDYGTTAGLLGLGPHQISIVSQLAEKFGKSFTYCLPTLGSSSGYLTFGTNGEFPSTVKFTPLVPGKGTLSYYNVDLMGIIVGGKRLSIPETVFSNAGTIVDSGTIITRLPEMAYTALKTAFRSEMEKEKYTLIGEFSILDTCYDLSDHLYVTLPTIKFIFAPNVEIEVPQSGLLWSVDNSMHCLAFAKIDKNGKHGIIGSVQQMTMQVVYDLAGSRIGFGMGGCE